MTPRRHTPAALLSPSPGDRPEAWAIGIETRPGEFGMNAGPFPQEATALEKIGDEGELIIHFLADGRDRVAWRWDADAWLEVPEGESPAVGLPKEARVIVHTDGSASVKSKTGGWAFVVRFGGKVATRCGRADGTTISIMELTAIRKALDFLKAGTMQVDVYTDSQYARNALGEWGDGWERDGWITATGKHVQHVDLIKNIRATLALHRTIRTVNIHWIKGHAGHTDNHTADDLAGQARRYPKQVTWTAADWKFHRDYEQKYGKPHTTKSSV
jgi:ribonuclease HI